MSTQSWQNRLYSTLLRESQKGAPQRHCAYMAAGWLSLFLVRPKLPASRAPSFAAIAGGGALLIGALMLLGPVLNTLQPALRAAGHAPASTWPTVFGAGIFAWRYLAGRKVLSAYALAVSAA